MEAGSEPSIALRLCMKKGWKARIVPCVVVFSITLLLAGFLAVYAIKRFESFHWGLPLGCDQFGYLNLSIDLFEGNGPHLEYAFSDGLNAFLKERFSDSTQYRWFVAPHAYCVFDQVGRPVNQYPPGTSLVLATIPLEWRKLLYPAVVILLLLVTSLAFVSEGPARVWSVFGLLAFFAVGMTHYMPFRFELENVGSVAPTFLLLILAGVWLRNHPLRSVAVLSLAVLFRVASFWLIPIPALFFVLRNRNAGESLAAWGRRLVVRAVIVGLVSFATGVGWQMLYQWIAVGSPFSTTYSPIDQEGASWGRIVENWHFYVTSMPPWMIFHLILVGVCMGVGCLRRDWMLLFLSFAIPLWNYGFFISHKVFIPYYPYASSFFLLGLFLRQLADLDYKWSWVLGTVCSLSAVGIALWWGPVPRTSIDNRYEENRKMYREVFADFDVVWAEIRSGTVVYVTDAAGFRFKWGGPPARRAAFEWLYENGYRQVLWLDDFGMDPDEALRFLEEAGIPYELRQHPVLGRMAFIEAKSREKPNGANG